MKRSSVWVVAMRRELALLVVSIALVLLATLLPGVAFWIALAFICVGFVVAQSILISRLRRDEAGRPT
jgi:hypothetical protein